MSRMQPVIDWGAYIAVRAVVCLVQMLSLETCRAGAGVMARFAWHVLRLRRQVVLDNLEIAFPEKPLAERHALALAMWEHLLLMVCEIAHAPRKVHRTNWRKHSAIPQMPTMTRHLLDKRPLVIVCAHLGNFEMGGYLMGLHGFPTHSIARTLDNPFLHRWVTEFRGATGQYMLPKTGSGGQIEEVLDRGGTLALLGDQHAGPRGCWVDFFGKPASTHKAVAVFSLSGGSPTAVSAVVRLPGVMKFEMQLADVFDPAQGNHDMRTIPEVTAWYTQQLEQLIRAHPDQYWWVHRRWKGSPEDRRRRRARVHGQATG